ncbi:DUF2269 family protein [Legionella sp. CNM-1927-20]|uniref:DUF2269 family protein n=1 Tax=Legionella sp. CNM-1927-20 TaxID=3422221 RepID=UPI00403AF85E
MNTYLFVKTLHIISSTVLFGTGIGIAFFMFRLKFTNNLYEKYYAVRNTVLADFLFTTPAVIVQPLTGIWLILLLGYPWNAPWLLASYFLYLLTGCFWLPVVWIQIKLRNILAHCIKTDLSLPANYHTLFKIWFILGFPAFSALVCIFYLMTSKILPFS